MRQNLKMKIYNTGYSKGTTEVVDICVHGKHDILGYQELMDGDHAVNIRRRATVTCRSAEGVLVVIHKSHIEPFLRRNSDILLAMISKFSKLVDAMIKNSEKVKKSRKPKPQPKAVKSDGEQEPEEDEGEADATGGPQGPSLEIEVGEADIQLPTYPPVREQQSSIDVKATRKWQSVEKLNNELARQPSPTSKLMNSNKDIPTQY